MLRRGAAAAADDIDQSGAGEFAEQFGHVVRAFVVIAEFIRQAGIRIGADESIGDAAKFLDMRAHFGGAERTVQPDGDRIGMLHGVPERRRRLAGQKTAGAVGDGAGNHHRHIDAARVARFRDGVDRRLGIERVEDGFDQQKVGAAVEQTLDLLGVSRAQLVEGNGAETGIGNVRRNRRGPVGRPERAGDETWNAVLGLGVLGRLARQPRAREIQLIGNVFHAVIGLRDGRRGKRVGRDDVGAGLEVGIMNVADRARPRQIQEIVVAAHFAVPGIEARAAIAVFIQLERLDHRAHRAIEHENALAHGGEKSGADAGVVSH